MPHRQNPNLQVYLRDAVGAASACLLPAPLPAQGRLEPSRTLQPASPGCCLPSVAETWHGCAACPSGAGAALQSPPCLHPTTSAPMPPVAIGLHALPHSGSPGTPPVSISPSRDLQGSQIFHSGLEIGQVGLHNPPPWALPSLWGQCWQGARDPARDPARGYSELGCAGGWSGCFSWGSGGATAFARGCFASVIALRSRYLLARGWQR